MADVFVVAPPPTASLGRKKPAAAVAPAPKPAAAVSPPPPISVKAPAKQPAVAVPTPPPPSSSPAPKPIVSNPSPQKYPTTTVQSISEIGSLYHPPRTLEFASDLDLVRDARLGLSEAETKWKAVLYYEATQAVALDVLRAASEVAVTLAQINRTEKDLQAKKAPSAKAVIADMRSLVKLSNFGGQALLPPLSAEAANLEATLRSLQAKANDQQDRVDELYEDFKKATENQERLEIERELDIIGVQFGRGLPVIKASKPYDRVLGNTEIAAQALDWTYELPLPGSGGKLPLKRTIRAYKDENRIPTFSADFHLPEGSPFKRAANNAWERRFDKDTAARVELQVITLPEKKGGEEESSAKSESLSSSSDSVSSSSSESTRQALFIQLLANRMTGPSTNKIQRDTFKGLSAKLLRSLILHLRKAQPAVFTEGGETIIGVEAMNERPTSMADVDKSGYTPKEFIEKVQLSDRDQRALERYYESLSFVRDDAFYTGANKTAVGMSTTVNRLLEKLPEL
jgi:hypothetical protein